MSDGERMRIALAIGTLGRGGAETQLVGLARQLRAMGHDVEVILMSQRGPLQVGLDESGIPVWCAGITANRGLKIGQLRAAIAHNTNIFVQYLKLFNHIRLRRYDVLHAFLFHSYAPLVPLAWLFRIPVRIAARRGLHASLRSTIWLRPMTLISTRAATAVIANSEAVADDAYVNERVPRSKLHVIHNGLALPPSQAHSDSDPPVGLLVANLIRYKGHLDLVSAVQLLPPSAKDKTHIRCIGEGPMRTEIAAALDVAGLPHQVLLEGSREAAPLYLDSQYALLVSHQEGLPNAILEAMAAGLAVVATDVGGCGELVQDGVTGLLVPAHNPAALASALARIILDVNFRVEAGRRGREHAAKFSWDRSAQAHSALYTSLLQRKRR